MSKRKNRIQITDLPSTMKVDEEAMGRVLGGGDLGAKLDEWEASLSSAGDDAQLANLDMQSMLQRQQQTLQTMSNVSKTLHDTSMSVVRKIG